MVYTVFVSPDHESARPLEVEVRPEITGGAGWLIPLITWSTSITASKGPELGVRLSEANIRTRRSFSCFIVPFISWSFHDSEKLRLNSLLNTEFPSRGDPDRFPDPAVIMCFLPGHEIVRLLDIVTAASH